MVLSMVPRPRLTPARRLVLRILEESGRHLTAAEVYQEARARSQPLSYATIYNALNRLVAMGLVRRLEWGEGPARFDRRQEPHAHVVCQRCGRVQDVDLPALGEVLAQVQRTTAFTLSGCDLRFTGLCPACQVADHRERGE